MSVSETLVDTRPQPSKSYRWLVLIFVSLAMFGSYYIYDSINPLERIFLQQLNYSASMFGWLNASYSVAAVATLLIGGILIDRFGIKKSLLFFSALILLGALLTSLRGNFYLMVAGRAVVGLGAESQIVAVTTALAGWLNSLLPFSAMIATPLFGLLADRIGKRATLMVVGSFLMMPVYLMIAYSSISLLVPVSLMGIAFSLIPAVMWPSVAYIVDERRLGTAYALMSLLQQIGFFIFNLAIGKANDISHAGPTNFHGYALGMWIFSILGFLALLFALLLRQRETGPNAHGLETITTHSQA